MSEKFKIHEEGVFFITLTVVGWIDIFTRYEYADLVIENLNYCIRSKGLKVYAFCIMPSHLHMIAEAEKGNLSYILRDFKSYTAKQIIQLVEEHPQESRKDWLLYMFRYFANNQKHNKTYQLWQQHNHPIDLYSAELFQQKVEYIHQNPVAACLVDEPQHYIYSSANPLTFLQLSEY